MRLSNPLVSINFLNLAMVLPLIALSTADHLVGSYMKIILILVLDTELMFPPIFYWNKPLKEMVPFPSPSLWNVPKDAPLHSPVILKSDIVLTEVHYPSTIQTISLFHSLSQQILTGSNGNLLKTIHSP